MYVVQKLRFDIQRNKDAIVVAEYPYETEAAAERAWTAFVEENTDSNIAYFITMKNVVVH